MILKDKKIPCSLIVYDKSERITHFSTLNPYSGMIHYVFKGWAPSEVEFHYENNTYRFELYGLGGRYFMKGYEESPFNRLFNLDSQLKSRHDKKKLKI